MVYFFIFFLWWEQIDGSSSIFYSAKTTKFMEKVQYLPYHAIVWIRWNIVIMLVGYHVDKDYFEVDIFEIYFGKYLARF